jgi:chemotaxis methyl-accepting protein methylase
LEFLDKAKVRSQLQIFASDISEPAIQKGASGRFTPKVLPKTFPEPDSAFF